MSVIEILKFGVLVDKATKNKLSEPDWGTIYKISDLIRTGEISPKHALSALKKRLNSDDRRVVLISLSILETIMNNCGKPVHDEVLSTSFVTDLLYLKHRNQVTRGITNGLINIWETAFERKLNYIPLHNAFREIKSGGYRFTPFTDREYAIIANLSSSYPNPSLHSTEKMNKTDSDATAARLKELQLAEEEELNLALALSASEAEAEKQLVTGGNIIKIGETTATIPSKAESVSVSHTEEEANIDTELARYLNRNYWTRRATASSDVESTAFQPTAPVYFPPMNPNYTPSLPDANWQDDQMFSLDNTKFEGQYLPGIPPVTDEKREEFLGALRKSIDIFVNRIRVNSQRNRSIQNDPTIQTLFHTLHAMHPQLLQYSSGLEERRVYLEQLQDTSIQCHDAREALDMLRAENVEKRRLEEAEASRKRQIQLVQKVESLRLEKQRVAEEQRKIALEQTLQFQQQFQYQSHPLDMADPSMGCYTSAGGVRAPNHPWMIPAQSMGATNYMNIGYAYQPNPMQFPGPYDQSFAAAPSTIDEPKSIAPNGLAPNIPENSYSQSEFSSRKPIYEFSRPNIPTQDEYSSEAARSLQATEMNIEPAEGSNDSEEWVIPSSGDQDSEKSIHREIQGQDESKRTKTSNAPMMVESDELTTDQSPDGGVVSILEMPEVPTNEFISSADSRQPKLDAKIICLE